MNNIFDGSSQIAVNLPGPAWPGRVQPAPVQPLLQQRHQRRRDHQRRRLRGQRRRDLRQSRLRRPRRASTTPPPRTSSSSRIRRRSTRAGARSGPLAGGNAIYPGTNLTLSGGQVIGTRTDPTTLPTQRSAGQVRPVRRGRRLLRSTNCSSGPTIRGRSSPCRDRATSPSPTSGSRS